MQGSWMERGYGFFALSAVLCTLLAGCSNLKLYGRLEKLSSATYASQALFTPDPDLKDCPNGQRLVVSWVLPPRVHPEHGGVLLDCLLYTSKGRQIHEQIPIAYNCGHWEYEMVQKRLAEEGAIVAYFLVIKQQERELARFAHKLFKSRIQEQESESEQMEQLE